MPISVPCLCGKTLSVKDELAGKRGKCPACGAMLSIPLPPPAKPAPKPVEEEEWGLVPLDDEKPAKAAPKAIAATTAKPQASAAASASNATKPIAPKSAPAKPAPAKAPEPEEWALAPLDDEVVKPTKPVENPAATPAKPQASAVTSASNAPKPAPPKSAPQKAPEPEEWGLAPLDDDLFGKPAAKPAAAKPVPAAKPAAKPVTPAMSKPAASAAQPAVNTAQPAVNTAKPPVNTAQPATKESASNNTVAAGSAAPPKKIPLGGPAPAPLDLAPLEDETLTKPAVNGKPQANGTSTSAKGAAASTSKNLGGPAPAPLDLAPLEGDEPENNHAAWIDEGAETQFKLSGPPTPTSASIGSAVVMKPAVREEEREGVVSCPHCGDLLKRTLTVWNLPFRLMFGRLIVAFLGTPAAFKCKRCGLVHYEELRGASRRAAGTGFQHLMFVMGMAFLLITTVGSLGYTVLDHFFGPKRPGFTDWDQKRRDEDRQREEFWANQRRMGNNPTVTTSKPSKSKTTPQKTPPTPPVKTPESATPPTTTPKSAVPVPAPPMPTAPLTPTPTPTPKPAASPFEETTLPPTTPPPTALPKPMPVNPFQPID
jgi:hypothetical protein